MKLLIIRHGDPDYSIDSLTEKGWREAELLADRICKEDVKAFYVSPLGRAKATASCTLKRINRTAEECLWLREFEAPIMKPNLPDAPSLTWDWLPQDWTAEPIYYQPDLWYTTEIMKNGHVKEAYDWVSKSLDQLLLRHGYRRNGKLYHAESPNEDTIVFFCHFGLECVLLSHLLNISPMVLWHSFCAAPTSVTTMTTEERRPGIVTFRMNAFGDISHLKAANEPPSFSARFCETYTRTDQRHD